jgi:hypothetical protein
MFKIKKNYLSYLFFFQMSFISADMTYDPVNNTIYSTPFSDEINQLEYWYLVQECMIVVNNMKILNGGINPAYKDILKQLEFALKKVKTPTANRLLKDLKKNKVFYPDGSVASKCFD